MAILEDMMASWWTPPKLARFVGVAAEKINKLITTGQLKAHNLAVNPRGRPRWRISPEEVERFLEARSNKAPPPPKPRRRRRAEATAGREYF